MKTEPNQWTVSLIVGGCLLAVLLAAAFQVPEWRALPPAQEVAQAADEPTATPLGMALLGVRVDAPATDEAGGEGLSGYLLPFEIVSVHLLVVLIGSAYLARAKRRVRTRSIQ